MTALPTDSLVERLRGKRVRVHDLGGVGFEIDPDCVEAAERVTHLQEALAAAEAERDEAKRVFETNIDRAENQWKAWEARAEAAEAKLASLSTLLAETREKALEDAGAHLAHIADAMWERCETQRPTELWAKPPQGEKDDAVTAWCFQKAAEAVRSLKTDEVQK